MYEPGRPLDFHIAEHVMGLDPIKDRVPNYSTDPNAALEIVIKHKEYFEWDRLSDKWGDLMRPAYSNAEFDPMRVCEAAIKMATMFKDRNASK